MADSMTRAVDIEGRGVQVNGRSVGGGSEIPDSVVYQYDAGTFATGDTSWADSVGSADMSISGDPQSVSLSDGSGVEGDGTDDYGSAAVADIATNQTLGLAFTVSLSSISNFSAFYGVSDDSNPTNRIAALSGLYGSAGSIEPIFVDANDNRIEVYTTNQYDDGNIHSVIINKSGNTASDIDIYVDDMTTPVSTSTQSDGAFDHTNFNQSRNVGFWSRNNGGSISGYIPATFGVLEFKSEPYTESDRTGFVDRRLEV